MPLSFDLVLVTLFFYTFGDILKCIKNDLFDSHLFLKTLIFAAVWILLFFFIYEYSGRYFEYAVRCYPMGFLSVICACFGCLTLIGVSVMADKIGGIDFKFLQWMGRNSFLIYIAHYFDGLYMFVWRHGNSYTALILRFIFDLSVAYFAYKIKAMICNYKKINCKG